MFHSMAVSLGMLTRDQLIMRIVLFSCDSQVWHRARNSLQMSEVTQTDA